MSATATRRTATTRWAQTEWGNLNHCLVFRAGDVVSLCGLRRASWYPAEPGGLSKACAYCASARGPATSPPP